MTMPPVAAPIATDRHTMKLHPLWMAAAVAVILFCLVGTAAILGWIPGAGSGGNKQELSEFDRAALASRLAQDDPALPARMSHSDAALPVQRFAQVERDQERAAPAPRNTPPQHIAQAAPASNWCANCGNIESVREVTQRAQGSGLGAAGGAVLGGLLGNQIGGGHGRQLATVAGAVGGAVVGNQVEGNMKATRSYDIRVRLDDGSTRSFSQQSAAGWRSGDRVKVVNGALRPVH